jgi:hypothetical protein
MMNKSEVKRIACMNDWKVSSDRSNRMRMYVDVGNARVHLNFTVLGHNHVLDVVKVAKYGIMRNDENGNVVLVENARHDERKIARELCDVFGVDSVQCIGASTDVVSV